MKKNLNRSLWNSTLFMVCGVVTHAPATVIVCRRVLLLWLHETSLAPVKPSTAWMYYTQNGWHHCFSTFFQVYRSSWKIFFPLPWPLARTAAVTARVMSCRWRFKACRCWTHPGAPGTLFLRETYSSAPSWTSCREQGWEHSCQDFHPEMLRLTIV